MAGRERRDVFALVIKRAILLFAGGLFMSASNT